VSGVVKGVGVSVQGKRKKSPLTPLFQRGEIRRAFIFQSLLFQRGEIRRAFIFQSPLCKRGLEFGHFKSLLKKGDYIKSPFERTGLY
jgi:hypothetical protein